MSLNKKDENFFFLNLTIIDMTAEMAESYDMTKLSEEKWNLRIGKKTKKIE